jgi:hypothetical protein
MCNPRKIIICDNYGECLWMGVTILKVVRSFVVLAGIFWPFIVQSVCEIPLH